MRRFKSIACIFLCFCLLCGIPIAEAAKTTYDIETTNASVGQEYVLIIVEGEQNGLTLADNYESIRYIGQKTATDSNLAFNNIKPAEFEVATAFIISEKGVLAKSLVLDERHMNTIVLPLGIRVIDAEAFMGIKAESVKLPEGVLTIGERAFANCPELKEIHIPSSVELIEENVFQNSQNVVIYGFGGSAAEEYAAQNGIRFIGLD